MWCPVGYRRASDVLQSAKQLVEELSGLAPGTSAFRDASYELCARALCEVETLSVAFLDGRMFRVDRELFLTINEREDRPNSPSFMFLDGNLEVHTWRIEKAARRMWWRTVNVVYSRKGLAERFRQIVLRLPHSEMPYLNAHIVKLVQIRRLRNGIKRFKGCPLVFAEGHAPSLDRLTAFLHLQSASSADQAASQVGRPAVVPSIARALRQISPDEPIDATYKEIFNQIKNLVGKDFSPDSYNRAKKLAWPQKDGKE